MQVCAKLATHLQMKTFEVETTRGLGKSGLHREQAISVTLRLDSEI